MPSQKVQNANPSKQQQAANDLPVPIHPDDAKDKVLTAILKALLKMENKPSSPKELATIINKYKYATLGGATPFATVSSRISQHFKRAATHNPPRPPLLEKHVDQKHSRKISYSLALDSASSTTSSPPPVESIGSKRKQLKPSSVSSLSSMSDSETESQSEPLLNNKKRKLKPIRPDIFISPHSPPPSQDNHIKQVDYTDDDDTSSEHSDYHEEMLKQVDDNTTIQHHLATRRYSVQTDTSVSAERKASFCSGYPTTGDQELWTSFSFNNELHQQEDHHHHHDDPSAHLIPFHIDTPESVSVSELDDYFSNDYTTRKRRSLSKSMLGPNDESLLEKVLLDSAAKGVADKLDKPQHHDGNTTTDHKADTVKMEAIKEEEEEEEENTSHQQKEEEHKETPKAYTLPHSSSSSSSNHIKLFNSDTMNGEDFVRFEEEEEEEEEEKNDKGLPFTQQQLITTQQSTLSSSIQSIQSSSSSSSISQQQNIATMKKVADILPAATPSQQQQNIINAAEILKSMNIQTLNLSALHHMTSNIPSLQHLSPAFDLAKTMAAYMQSLAKSANANSSAPLATDLKNILSRFPALEAFIKKDQPTLPNNNNTAASLKPAVSSKPYVPPNHIQGKDQVVYTVNAMDPPMYITVIDSIAVCVVIFSTKSPVQEFRIMRRLDNQFINGTTLLTAGGIETERERSMILSFEMDRVRMPKSDHALFGTWIPLRRAQELARTCSIQHALAEFLDADLLEFFPKPLPIKIVSKKKPPPTNHRLAMALAAMRKQRKPQSSIDNPNKLLKNADNMIKKSASWSGVTGVKRQPSHKRKQAVKHVSDDEEEVIIDIDDDDEEVNVVVEHKTQVPVKENKVQQDIQIDEEEEDIDIGGSDCDDDLR